MKYILDTNTCIYIIKKRPAEVEKKFREFMPGDIGVSSICLAELNHGIQKSAKVEENQIGLDEFTLPLIIVPFDESAANEYGKIRAYLERNGTPIGPMDTLIGAHAKSMDVTLVTNNIKEFERIPDLKIENWVNLKRTSY
ncbi:MAG: type II toxin-antitoxin system VapC family toxin [Okeania sp. SIO3C4]|nr:type II toxin-antitoxin system VapC family toxin [Okeania sp. SIO3C4]